MFGKEVNPQIITNPVHFSSKTSFSPTSLGNTHNMNSDAKIKTFSELMPTSDIKSFKDRKMKPRSNINDLLKESALESKKSLAKKQMRFMTTQYRKQIKMINEGLNTNVPTQINAQESIAQRHKKLKNEILKRP